MAGKSKGGANLSGGIAPPKKGTQYGTESQTHPPAAATGNDLESHVAVIDMCAVSQPPPTNKRLSDA